MRSVPGIKDYASPTPAKATVGGTAAVGAPAGTGISEVIYERINNKMVRTFAFTAFNGSQKRNTKADENREQTTLVAQAI